MVRKSFVTSMPDKAGAFLLASKIIAKYGGNIVRVSYNKAVDLHMLFLDVVAAQEQLDTIEKELLAVGYLNERIAEMRVIEVSVRIPDRPGGVLPVLEVLHRHNINISYINSAAEGAPYQDFKLGLLIEDPRMIKTLLDECSAIYPIDIIQCDSNEENLDNTVFYIRLAGEMQKLLGLDAGKTMAFITESNRILQALQGSGEDARKVFDYIRRFAHFVGSSRGDKFRPSVEKLTLKGAALYVIRPPFGSNTYVFDTGGELVLIDSGYAVYAEEMKKVFRALWPDFEGRPKQIYITHADVDHCGLLSVIADAPILLNRKSARSLERQARGLPDSRENTELRIGYSRISRIISGYVPPDPARFTVIDEGTPEEHETLLKIGALRVGGLVFEIYEGSGGHLPGELVYACSEAGVLFTGDILVNIEGFSQKTAEFNALAPYLMKSVNVDSGRVKEMRRCVTLLAAEIAGVGGTPCIICGGHGPVSALNGGKLTAFSDAETVPVEIGEGA